MAEYKSSSTILIADVDCTAGGKSKCDEAGVRGYPTIKYGDPSDLQDYKGGRSFSDLKKFAESLGPSCGPANLDLCDESKEKKIKDKEGEMSKIEADFKEFVEGLQKQYKDASDKKEKDLEGLKDSGLGLLKSVHAYEKKSKTEL